MFKRLKWVLAIMISGGLAVAANTGKITGKISDAESGEGLYGAKIEIVGTTAGALADVNGYFHIINLAPGSYTVRARMTGYATMTIIDVRVNPGLSTKSDIKLRVSPIQGQEVTVTAVRPLVVKDLTATQRVIKTSELALMPFDNPQQALASQSGVVMKGEQYHIRGGRSDEVSYLIDGISIRDPVDGTTGLLVNTNALSELRMMTGVLDAEYGQVMSGVIDAQVRDGSTPGLHLSVNTDTIIPGSTGRGHGHYQADWGRGFWNQRVRFFTAGDLGVTNDWDPHQQIVPHQNRQNYSLLGKLSGLLTENIRISLSGIISRDQYDRYGHDWYFAPNSYRSDLQRGKLITTSLNHALSRSAFYTVDAGWFWNRSTYGVRDTFWDIGRHWWEDMRFLDYWDNQVYRDEYGRLKFTADYNRYGYDCPLFYRFGSYWKYRNRVTDERFVKGEFTIQANRYHQLKAGLQHKQYRLYNFYLYPSSLANPVFDEYRYYPSFQEFYVHDKMEFEGLILNLGIRLERLDINITNPDTAALWYRRTGKADLSPKHGISPRLGLSYVISPVTTFHVAYGRFFQQPLFQQYYQYLNVTDPMNMRGNVLGNPALTPPTATSMEFGTVTELGKEWSLDFTFYYKDIRHLVSLNYIPDSVGYYQYQNVDYATSHGAEVTVRKQYGHHATGELRYAYATAEGTASDAEESWRQYLILAPQDSLAGFERKTKPLAFDQRHKLFGVLSLFNKEPLAPTWWGRLATDVNLSVLLQIGSGLPHVAQSIGLTSAETNIAATEWSPATKRVDLKLSKVFKTGPTSITASFEVINLANWNNYNTSYEREISPYERYIKWWFLGTPSVDYRRENSPKYDAAGDTDNNGVFSVAEQKVLLKYYQDLLTNNPALSGPPRLFRIGLSFNW